ncbi:MAG TPA: ABC transporter ATP-binding protein [Candidatus Pullichristensenella excrementigallinarum]|uniref:ABC transporter ATP-binding protein n=1 Tax=Candidatus Pullichristensenella excrementigallinarum TaxID=2840907 RepID=A0A9D1IBW5_9FIRM|nr:ABC transporter ATP-binding protein [Candidatus Pullichristensenella excrementigallinarum]
MLSVRDICKAFGEKSVLRHVSFDFPRGVTAITGPSGCGKSTLLNILMGLLPADQGEVVFAESVRMAAVFQEDRLIEHLSAAKNIRLTCPREISDSEIERALARLGLPQRDGTRVAKYSGGMRRRVAIARAALHRANLLILDEPFQGLDAEARAQAVDFLLPSAENAVVLLVSHDREDLRQMGARGELILG